MTDGTIIAALVLTNLSTVLLCWRASRDLALARRAWVYWFRECMRVSGARELARLGCNSFSIEEELRKIDEFAREALRRLEDEDA